MYKVRAGYLSHEKHRVTPWINVQRAKHYASPQCSFLWTSRHQAVLLLNKVRHSKNSAPAVDRPKNTLVQIHVNSRLCFQIPRFPFTWPIQISTLESLTVHDFYRQQTPSVSSGPCKVLLLIRTNRWHRAPAPWALSTMWWNHSRRSRCRKNRRL